MLRLTLADKTTNHAAEMEIEANRTAKNSAHNIHRIFTRYPVDEDCRLAFTFMILAATVSYHILYMSPGWPIIPLGLLLRK